MLRAAPKITVVVATYNRAAALQHSLRTLLAQSLADWQALVIGDACTDDSADRVAALGDDRIRFVNLPERSGEQAAPNSVGMALADTPFVAFLNHDDFWLPDHLDIALRTLCDTGADMFWARAAFFTNRGGWDERILFAEMSPTGRSFGDMFDAPFYLAEPMSAWVARTDALRTLGPMTPASRCAVAPIVDYCLRAAHAGLTLRDGDRVAVLKDRVAAPPPLYQSRRPFAEALVRAIERGETPAILDQIDSDLRLSRALGLGRSFAPPAPISGEMHRAQVFARTGYDLARAEAQARRSEPQLLTRTLKNRTGETIDRQPELAALIDHARRAIG